MSNPKTKKQRVFEIISGARRGDPASNIFALGIMILIFLSILHVVMDSYKPLHDLFRVYFEGFEIFTSVIFTAEYLLRLWTADLLYPEAKHPRLKYCCSMLAVIDFLAILPFFLYFISSSPRFVRVIRMLRLARILRVIKLARYFSAMRMIFRVIRKSATQLITSIVICFFVMLIAAIMMYDVEHDVQPEQFPDVMASLWWAMCTLTTVGYGDIYPITSGGRFLASVISLIGIGIIAIPTGIIAAGFNHAITRQEETEELSEGQKGISQMTDSELLDLQGKIGRELAGRGYVAIVSRLPDGEGSRAGTADPDAEGSPAAKPDAAGSPVAGPDAEVRDTGNP